MSDARHNVVFVEDDAFLQKILTTKFAKEGFGVSAASDAEEGFRLVRSQQPDVILLDLILPGGVSGFELLEAIRADKSLNRVPVIVLSNLGHDEDVRRAMSLGATDVIVKADASLNQIVQRVREALVGTP